MNSDIFKAMGAPKRLKIIELLNKNEKMNATEISNNFSISKPAVSEHLKILKNVNLINREKIGQFVIYKLNMKIFNNIITYLSEFVEKENKRLFF